MLNIDQKSYRSGVKVLDDAEAGMVNATRRAANKSVRKLRTELVRHLSRLSGFPNKRIKGRRRTIVKTATNTDLSASLWQGINELPLIYKKRARSIARSTEKPGYSKAFVATMRSGHTGIYRRKLPSGRLPIFEDMAQILPSQQRAQIERYYEQQSRGIMQMNLDHELDFEFVIKPGSNI